MARRMTDEVVEIGNQMHIARVWWDNETEEFVVTYRGKTYHTESRRDAVATANAMMGACETMRYPRNVPRSVPNN